MNIIIIIHDSVSIHSNPVILGPKDGPNREILVGRLVLRYPIPRWIPRAMNKIKRHCILDTPSIATSVPADVITAI